MCFKTLGKIDFYVHTQMLKIKVKWRDWLTVGKAKKASRVTNQGIPLQVYQKYDDNAIQWHDQNSILTVISYAVIENWDANINDVENQ